MVFISMAALPPKSGVFRAGGFVRNDITAARLGAMLRARIGVAPKQERRSRPWERRPIAGETQ
jgi:hypothetical protein